MHHININIIHFLYISNILFFIGFFGIIINRRNILIIIMSIELILLAINFNFIIFSVYQDNMLGQIFALFVLTVAAAESALGLAILVVYYRLRGTIAVDQIHIMKG